MKAPGNGQGTGRLRDRPAQIVRRDQIARLALPQLRAHEKVYPRSFDPTKYAYKGSFTGGRANLSGFAPGKTIWVRVRKIGTKGGTGGWSDPASIMVT